MEETGRRGDVDEWANRQKKQREVKKRRGKVKEEKTNYVDLIIPNCDSFQPDVRRRKNLQSADSFSPQPPSTFPTKSNNVKPCCCRITHHPDFKRHLHHPDSQLWLQSWSSPTAPSPATDLWGGGAAAHQGQIQFSSVTVLCQRPDKPCQDADEAVYVPRTLTYSCMEIA